MSVLQADPAGAQLSSGTSAPAASCLHITCDYPALLQLPIRQYKANTVKTRKHRSVINASQQTKTHKQQSIEVKMFLRMRGHRKEEQLTAHLYGAARYQYFSMSLTYFQSLWSILKIQKLSFSHTKKQLRGHPDQKQQSSLRNGLLPYCLKPIWISPASSVPLKVTTLTLKSYWKSVLLWVITTWLRRNYKYCWHERFHQNWFFPWYHTHF